MSLCFDFGNTRVKSAYFEPNTKIPDKIIAFEYDKLADFKKWLNQYEPITPVIISSVNDNESFINEIEQTFNSVVNLSHKLNLPFIVDYDTPETLGNDRLAACAGAMCIYSERPLLLIDAGTCITYDFISGDNVYMGGAISPGIEMKLKAMHQFTNKLPMASLSIDYKPFNLQKTTKNCLLEGAYAATVHEIRGFIATFSKHMPLQVIINGGSAQYLADKIENSTFAAPNLVLIGLHEIRKLNAD